MSRRPDGAPSRARPSLVWSAVLLAIVIIAAVVVAIIGQGSAAEEPPTSDPSAVVDTNSDSRCGLSDADQSMPTTGGPSAEWDLIERIAVPSTEKYGPGDESNGLRVCFAQSPTGAVVAAYNMAAQFSSSELARDAYEEFLASGPGRDALLASFEPSTASDDLSVQLAGFQLLEFSMDRAVVDLVARGSNGAIVSTPVHLVWEDGDWRVSLQDNGQPFIAPRSVPSLAGYIKWAGA